MNYHIFASTMLDDGTPYYIAYMVNECGDCRFRGGTRARIPCYQLIHLHRKVLKILGIPHNPYLSEARWKYLLAGNGPKKYVGLVVNETTYLLTKKVTGTWLNNPHMVTLAQYFDEPTGGYAMPLWSLINDVPEWEIFVREEAAKDDDESTSDYTS